jgi:hypothetical protein
MGIEIVERAIAVFGSLIVGGTALYQLKNELPMRGLDSFVTKLLLGLMIVGCVLAFFAALNILGNFGTAA